MTLCTYGCVSLLKNRLHLTHQSPSRLNCILNCILNCTQQSAIRNRVWGEYTRSCPITYWGWGSLLIGLEAAGIFFFFFFWWGGGGVGVCTMTPEVGVGLGDVYYPPFFYYKGIYVKCVRYILFIVLDSFTIVNDICQRPRWSKKRSMYK